MILETAAAEYGKRLTSAREKMGITLEEVSYELKINLSTLKRLESSESKKLPKPGFTKGFIKAYCKFLKISPDLILAEYMQSLDAPDLETKGSVLIETSEPKDFFILDFLKDKFFPLIVFASVVAAVFILYSFLGNYEQSHTTTAGGLNQDKMIDMAPPTVDNKSTADLNDDVAEEVTFEIFDQEEPAPKVASLKVEQKKDDLLKKNEETLAVKDSASSVVALQPEEVAEPEKPVYQPPRGKHKLVVEPLAKTYLYIKTNFDSRPIRATLTPEKVRTFRFDQAEIRFVDAGAVNVILDGDELGALGIFGEEKKLEFPSLKEL